MPSSVSGLGRLFGAATSSFAINSPRGQRQLESVTEEAHTYDLHYPDAGTLCGRHQHTYDFRHGDPASMAAAANSPDDKGGLNIKQPRDLRVIVGQYIGSNRSVLYDSQPSLLRSAGAISPTSIRGVPEELEQARGSSRFGPVSKSHTAPHTRHSSFSQVTQSMFSPSLSTLSPVNESRFTLGGPRKSAISEGENTQAVLANEEAKEIDAILETMFGALGFKPELGTKLHVKPYTPTEWEESRPPSAGTLGRSSQYSRRTPLTRSTTAEDLNATQKSAVPRSALGQSMRRKGSSIMVTRIFHADPQGDDGTPSLEGAESRTNEVSVEPSRGTAHSRATSTDEAKNRVNTPAFAISIVLYMPPQNYPRRHVSFKGSPSPNSSSDPASNTQYANKEHFDIFLAYVMAHWSMIDRALCSLEIVIRCQLCNKLAQLDVLGPLKAAMEPTPGMKPVKIRPPPRPTLRLPANSLQDDEVVQKTVDVVMKRIVTSLQVRMVTLGQERWGIWRDEARSIAKWAGSQEPDSFLNNALTAFLGCHTDWLQAMDWKVLRHSSRVKRDAVDHHNREVVKHRTVVVSQDKMAARRIIFLFSAFLPGPASQFRRQDQSRRGSTRHSASYDSPSAGTSLSHQPSLRWMMQKVHHETGFSDSRHRESAVLDTDASTEISDDQTVIEARSIRDHGRRASDVRSICSLGLSSAAERQRPRNISSATTATIDPDFSIPVPHFSAYSDHSPGTGTTYRPNSGGSIASLSLHRTRSRSESNDQSGTSVESHASGRWFWGSRRGSSTETSETPISSGEALGIQGSFKENKDSRSANKLARMVDEAASLSASPETFGRRRDHRTIDENDERHAPDFDGPSGDFAAPPTPPGLEPPFPIDLAVNEQDGVIDIKLPPSQDLSSNFGSLVSSPRALKTASNSFKDGSRMENALSSMTIPVPKKRSSQPTSFAGGWLRRFHADLVLQAVQPYDTLKEDVKQAMRVEPMCPTFRTPQEETTTQWQDVGSTIFVDVTSLKVTRITLRRRRASSPHHQADALLGSHSRDNPDEEFHEEVLSESDPSLIAAIEKIMSRSSHSSRTGSRAPSRAPSPPPSSTAHRSDLHHSSSARRDPAFGGLQVSRNECKKVILGALEQTARSVLMDVSGGGENSMTSSGSFSASGSSATPKVGSAGTMSTVTAADGKGKGGHLMSGAVTGKGSESVLRSGIRAWLEEHTVVSKQSER